jgi:hypothetical protein
MDADGRRWTQIFKKSQKPTHHENGGGNRNFQNFVVDFLGGMGLTRCE